MIPFAYATLAASINQFGVVDVSAKVILGISKFIIFALIQFDGNDLILSDALGQQIIPEEFKKQHRLATPANAGNNLDLTVMHMADHLIQIKIAFYHSTTSYLLHNCSNFQIKNSISEGRMQEKSVVYRKVATNTHKLIDKRT